MGNRVSPGNRWPWVLSAMGHLGVVSLVAALWVSMAPPPRGLPVIKLVSVPEPRPQKVVPTPTVPPRSPVASDALGSDPVLPTREAGPSPIPEPTMEASPPDGPPEPSVAEGPPAPAVPAAQTESEPDYLPQDQVTLVPRLPVEELRARIRYPAAARRLGLESTVGLELLIDRTGVIRQVLVIQDPGHGFAEAAVRAFEGLVCTPAQAKGGAVAVRFRVPVRFRLDQML